MSEPQLAVDNTGEITPDERAEAHKQLFESRLKAMHHSVQQYEQDIKIQRELMNEEVKIFAEDFQVEKKTLKLAMKHAQMEEESLLAHDRDYINMRSILGAPIQRDLFN